ncbi:unnamed protein product [Mortierella alpina]
MRRSGASTSSQVAEVKSRKRSLKDAGVACFLANHYQIFFLWPPQLEETYKKRGRPRRSIVSPNLQFSPFVEQENENEMHLDHAIPWKTISRHFSVRENNKLSSERLVTIDFSPRNQPHQKEELLYFSNALANTIQEFSTTERLKYPNKFPVESTGKVFSDELLQKRLALDEGWATDGATYLTAQNQRLEFWIQCARAGQEHDPETRPRPIRFTTDDMDLADAAKILIVENDLTAVLTLAHHPLIPFGDLIFLSWGHSFGIDRLVDYCLCPYIYLNILAEFPEWCQDEKYRKLHAFQSLERWITCDCDGDAQMGMHRWFYRDRKAKESQTLNQPWPFAWSRYESRDIFADMGRMKEYLKLCFAVLYRCDLVLRECGREIDWAGEIAAALRQLHVDIQVERQC